jgi:hypothetical protein
MNRCAHDRFRFIRSCNKLPSRGLRDRNIWPVDISIEAAPLPLLAAGVMRMLFLKCKRAVNYIAEPDIPRRFSQLI